MKKLAFFFALLVGLNATSVVRKPEEEENQAVVVGVDHNSTNKTYSSFIQRITTNIKIYFYVITKDGKKDILAWERISNLFKSRNKEPNTANINTILKNKINWILMNYKCDGQIESCDTRLFSKK